MMALIQERLIETLMAPRRAARRLLALPYDASTLWTVMALMSIFNAMAFSVSLAVAPPAPQVQESLPPVVYSPVIMAILIFGGLVFTVFVLTWVGKIMGGQGPLRDILLLITWLQFVRFLLQVAMLALTLVLPALAALLILVAMVWGIIILVCFVEVGHKLDNAMKSVAVLFFTIAGLLVGLSVFGAMILGSAGVPG